MKEIGCLVGNLCLVPFCESFSFVKITKAGWYVFWRSEKVVMNSFGAAPLHSRKTRQTRAQYLHTLKLFAPVKLLVNL